MKTRHRMLGMEQNRGPVETGKSAGPVGCGIPSLARRDPCLRRHPRTGFRSELGLSLALVLGLLMAPDAGAQSAKKKIIVLGRGEKSAVISGVAKTRHRLNHKEMVSAAKQRKEKLKTAKEERAETKKRIKAQLADVDAVAADLSETVEDDEDDGLVVESAIEAGVPVILENVSKAKMAKLVRVGVNAGTAIVETTEGGAYYKITMMDGPGLKVKSGPVKVAQPPAKKDPENKAHKKALEAYEAKQKAAMAKASKPSNNPTNTKLTSAQKTAHVEKVISEKAFRKGAKRHALLTGNCDGNTCIEGTAEWHERRDFCPQDPQAAACSTVNTLIPTIEFGIYKTLSYDSSGQPRPTAYVVTRAAGRPNLAMAADDKQDRGFYLDSWNIEFAATYPPNMGWRLDKAAPDNANRQATVTYSSGYSVGPTASIPPSVSFSYSPSTSMTMNTEEFGITRTTTDKSVSWLNKMQLDGLVESYTKPEDLFIYWWLSGATDVALLPTIARLGTDFHAEAIWYGNRDLACGKACNLKVDGTFTLNMYRAWVTGPERPGANNKGNIASYTVSAKIELDAVTDWVTNL